MSDDKTILITGGAGFIGSHLAGHLLGAGHRVIVMDNLLTGDISNISSFVGSDFLFVKHDVTEYIYLSEPLYAVLGTPDAEPLALAPGVEVHEHPEPVTPPTEAPEP